MALEDLAPIGYGTYTNTVFDVTIEVDEDDFSSYLAFNLTLPAREGAVVGQVQFSLFTALGDPIAPLGGEGYQDLAVGVPVRIVQYMPPVLANTQPVVGRINLDAVYWGDEGWVNTIDMLEGGDLWEWNA